MPLVATFRASFYVIKGIQGLKVWQSMYSLRKAALDIGGSKVI